MTKKNTVTFISLGCPRNFVDTEVIMSILQKEGFAFVNELAFADYVVINTCAFLKTARDEAYGILEEVFSQKKQSAKVILAGCMVKNHSEELKSKFPDIFSYVNSANIDKIAQAIKKQSFFNEHYSYLPDRSIKKLLAAAGHYGYLKIAEGCRKSCSYCIIPQIKGPLKSRPEQDIAFEFENMLGQGVKEVVLVAQDLQDYGKDLKKSSLKTLLKKLLLVKKDFWLRLLYVYPDEIDDELLGIMQSDGRICRYLDIPLQHVDNRILKLMKRNISYDQIVKLIDKLKKIPDFYIRSSFILGFPSEGTAEFQALCKFLQEYPIDHAAFFKYSDEELAQSYSYKGKIDESLKEDRLQKIIALQQEEVRKRNRRLIGKKLQVIIDGYHPDSSALIKSRHQGQAPEVDSCVIINDADKIDGETFLNATITDVADYDLIAQYKK